jgi:hypothetical protein
MPIDVKIFIFAIVLSLRPQMGPHTKPIELFNGRNLHEWTYQLEKPGVKPQDVWSVKDGVIHCTGNPAGYLLTKQNDFENYVLKLEWRWPEKAGNNGVLVHVTTPHELGVWPKCFEVQLQSGQAGELWVIGTQLEVNNKATHVEDRRHKNIITGAEKPVGEWNTMEIGCVGDEIDVKVNGYLVNSALKLSQQRGAIGLQSEGAPIEFRNIALKQLPPQALYMRQQQRIDQQRAGQRRLEFQRMMKQRMEQQQRLQQQQLEQQRLRGSEGSPSQ